MSDSPPNRLLFPPSLISASVRAGLPDGFTIRPLAGDDHAKGFYECLGALTWVGDGPTETEFRQRFDEMAAAADTYFFAVVEYGGRIVGTGCLVVEKKLYACFLPPHTMFFNASSIYSVFSSCLFSCFVICFVSFACLGMGGEIPRGMRKWSDSCLQHT